MRGMISVVGYAVLAVMIILVASFFIQGVREGSSQSIEEMKFQKACNELIAKYQCNKEEAKKSGFWDRFVKTCENYLVATEQESVEKCIEKCSCLKFQEIKKFGEKIFGAEEESGVECNPEKMYCTLSGAALFLKIQEFANTIGELSGGQGGMYLEVYDSGGNLYNCIEVDNSNKKVIFKLSDNSEKSTDWFLNKNGEIFLDGKEVKYIMDALWNKYEIPGDFYFWDCENNCNANTFRIKALKIEKPLIGKNKITFELENCEPRESFEKYKFKRTVTIEERSGSTLRDYPIMLTLDTESLIDNGKIKWDCSDMRFALQDNTPLDFWINPKTCDTGNTEIWVKIPSLGANEEKRIIMYYGNDKAKSVSNPYTVFLGFDDMEVLDIKRLSGELNAPEAEIIKEDNNKVLYLTLLNNGEYPSSGFIGYDKADIKEGRKIIFDFIIPYPINSISTPSQTQDFGEFWVSILAEGIESTSTLENLNGGYNIGISLYDNRFKLMRYKSRLIGLDGEEIDSKSLSLKNPADGKWHKGEIEFFVDENNRLHVKFTIDNVPIFNFLDLSKITNRNILEKLSLPEKYGNYIIISAREGIDGNYAVDDIIITPFVNPEPEVIVGEEEENES